jgi:hypothetical protein
VFECYPQKLNSDHVSIIGVLGMLLCKADVICVSGNLIVSRELEFGRAFREAIGNFGNTKYFFNYFSVKKKKKPVPCGIGPYLQGKL